MSARANSLRLLAPTLALLLAACAGDPILKLERQRARYSATMNGFAVRDDPATRKQEIVLDVLVQFDGQDPLDGVTVDSRWPTRPGARSRSATSGSTPGAWARGPAGRSP